MKKPGWVILSTIVTLNLYILSSFVSSPSKTDAKTPIKPLSLNLIEKKQVPIVLDLPKNITTKEYIVKFGDSFYTIFQKLNIPYQVLVDIQRAKNNHDFLRIQPKNKLLFNYQNDQLVSIEKQLSSTIKLTYFADSKTIYSSNVYPEIETRIVFKQGNVDDSLYFAGLQSGLTDTLIMNFIQIFSWDIDFNQDIRKGDQFKLIYEQRFSDGVFLENGRILVAQYINKGKSFQAILFKKDNKAVGYYKIDGSPLKKSFLRSPVAFSRISSRFSRGRYHPILHKIRAHRGVDYAAAIGTPVKAVGDGRVFHKGYSKGFGNTIVLTHANGIATLYAHLYGYKRGLKKGQKVKQGSIIGTVGQSGLATGPHLHYEFRINGKHQNPLKVKLPKAKKLNLADLNLFKANAKPLLLQFNALKYSLNAS